MPISDEMKDVLDEYGSQAWCEGLEHCGSKRDSPATDQIANAARLDLIAAIEKLQNRIAELEKMDPVYLETQWREVTEKGKREAADAVLGRLVRRMPELAKAHTGTFFLACRWLADDAIKPVWYTTDAVVNDRVLILEATHSQPEQALDSILTAALEGKE